MCLKILIHIVLPYQMFTEWKQRLGPQLNKKVVLLTGETSTDLRLLREVRPIPTDTPIITDG